MKLSNLFNITFIKETTPNYDDLKVELKWVEKKGVGVFAKQFITEDELIAYYKMIVVDAGNYTSPFSNTYTFILYDKNEIKIDDLIGDIYEESCRAPINLVPFWGFLTNEPDEEQSENVYVDINTDENYKYREKIYIGNIVVYSLYASKSIKPGEEITWYMIVLFKTLFSFFIYSFLLRCYGANYTRNYTTSCK